MFLGFPDYKLYRYNNYNIQFLLFYNKMSTDGNNKMSTFGSAEFFIFLFCNNYGVFIVGFSSVCGIRRETTRPSLVFIKTRFSFFVKGCL